MLITILFGSMVCVLQHAEAAESEEEKSARNHWSYQPLIKVDVPTEGQGWARNGIDRFIRRRHKEAGIMPTNEATPNVLARRIFFDVLGLPPSPEEVSKFVNGFDESEYKQMVDQLLASPHFGEQWARHWLDGARFAESAGFEQDFDRDDAWRYQDFVTRAFNEDIPYDKFVRLQIAGDLLQPDKTDSIIATGFIVAGVENLIQSRKEFVRDRYDKIDDMVSATATGLLGMTVACARCHDHKFDPILQRDYYRFAAAFAKTVSTNRDIKNDKSNIKVFCASEVPDGRIRMVVVSEPHRKNLPSVLAQVNFLDRGNTESPGEVMRPGFPRILLNGKDDSKWTKDNPGRVALANWITDTDGGAGQLLARVMVNRIWYKYFGRGIVATTSDFGTRGDRPTHPQLLDWLAGELIQNEWSLKHIHKLILMSATYRQGYFKNKSNLTANQKDPENLLLWHREPKRLGAESIRDNLLSVSGRLDRRLYGQGPGTMDFNSPRRTLYLRAKRARLVPLLQLFDASDSLQGIGNRQSTTTATQGLAILNDPFVDECIQEFVKRIAGGKPKDDQLIIEEGFLHAVGRRPTGLEKEICLEILKPGTGESRRDFCQMLFCLNEFIYVE